MKGMVKTFMIVLGACTKGFNLIAIWRDPCIEHVAPRKATEPLIACWFTLPERKFSGNLVP
jgi:hypothetical protein